MNIQEVARRARVSTATVSRTINGSDKVTAKTAEKVRRAIEAMNYYPNTNARALGSGKSRLYGLIISDITNPFFPELVKSFEENAVMQGLEVIVSNTSYKAERAELCVQRMLERKVDGIAIMTSELAPELVERLRNHGVRLVYLDTGTVGKGTSNVSINYSKGIDEAAAHLVALGHETIGFISGPLVLPSARSRRAAFLESLERAGITLKKSLIVEGNHRIDGGRMAMEQLLQLPKRPTAILCSNDLTAIGAIGSIHQHGLHVPKDISVIGFDDIEISASLYPPLTTVRLSRTQIADRAFHALFAASSDMGTEYIVQPELVVRETTAVRRKARKM